MTTVLHVLMITVFLLYTEGADYVVTPDPASVFMDEVSLQLVPVTVNVTLASDGIGGEGTEDIVLTLVQLPPIESERVLVNPTVRIIVEDNDSMYCSSGRLLSHCDNAHTYNLISQSPITTPFHTFQESKERWYGRWEWLESQRAVGQWRSVPTTLKRSRDSPWRHLPLKSLPVSLLQQFFTFQSSTVAIVFRVLDSYFSVLYSY